MWPAGVAGGLKGSRVTLEVMNVVMNFHIASWILGGLVGSWVVMRGYWWPLGVAVDLGGLRVTLITCQITNAPNFSIKP
jgi:hypothetical protein